MAEAPKPGTLRVKADVYAALGATAKQLGTTATALADQLLRDAMDMHGTALVDSKIGKARDAHRLASGRARAQAGADCKHPVNRRIGNGCAACGATVK